MQTLSARIVHAMAISTFAALTLVACSRKAADGSAADSVAVHGDTAVSAPATAATSNTANAAPTAASLGADDIDRWQRGMDAELKAVQDAGTQLKNAKNSTDSLNALFAANETSTRVAGAKAAGVDEQRYQLIANTLATLAADMSPIEQEMDMSKMPASAVESMKHAREQSLASASAGLSPALIEAMRPRAAVLRKQALTLAGERLKAAGMTS
jgi:hypothetical protein